MLFCAEHINAGYGKKQIVRDVSFSLECGCIMGIVGANGSGKTTLLKALCGVLPHEGRCFAEGAELEKMTARHIARLCSYIPQRSGINIDIPALDVVLMGFNPHLGIFERPTAAMKLEAAAALEKVGLSDRAEDSFLQLSEGQKQLCILARTLVSGSRVLMLDEPESALDFRRRYVMLELIREWVCAAHGGAIVTLHDPMLALNCCDRLLLMENGEAAGIISPREDSAAKIEEQLGRIYGPLSLHRCGNRSGREFLVMLKEDEG